MGFDEQDYISRIANKAAERGSQIRKNIEGREALLKKVYIDLSTARDKNNPLKISIPFVSVTVEGAADSTTYINLALGDNTLTAMDDSKILKQNDSFQFDDFVSSSFLWWPAQSGKYLTLVFATTGRFYSGSQISTIAGGFSISAGDTLASNKLSGSVAKIACPAGSATKILDADTSRKEIAIYIDAPAWIGDASTEPNVRGIYQPAGVFVFNSTAALYLYPVGGTVNVYGNDFR